MSLDPKALLDAAQTRIAELETSLGQAHADFYAMQDGALVHDLRARIAELKRELAEARRVWWQALID